MDRPAITRAYEWLWLFPILLSGLFDGHSRTRWISLLIYAVAAGFVYAGMMQAARPARYSLPYMVETTLVASGPLLVVVTFVIEWFTQYAYSWIREVRREEGTCAKCGYSIMHLTEPRCPECGEAFDPIWLESTKEPPAFTARPKRVIALAVLIASVWIAWPHGYKAYQLNIGIPRRGRAHARRTWARNEPRLYVGATDPRYIDIFFTHGYRDLATGVIIHPIRPFARRATAALVQEDTIWRNANNREVAALVRERGPLPICDYLLTYSRIKQLMDNPPKLHRWDDDSPTTVFGYANYALLPDKGDLHVQIHDDFLRTSLPTGEVLQEVYRLEIDQLIEALE
jgi:hypothetical protein